VTIGQSKYAWQCGVASLKMLWAILVLLLVGFLGVSAILLSVLGSQSQKSRDPVKLVNVRTDAENSKQTKNNDAEVKLL
jgi:hypothetical protein